MIQSEDNLSKLLNRILVINYLILNVIIIVFKAFGIVKFSWVIALSMIWIPLSISIFILLITGFVIGKILIDFDKTLVII